MKLEIVFDSYYEISHSCNKYLSGVETVAIKSNLIGPGELTQYCILGCKYTSKVTPYLLKTFRTLKINFEKRFEINGNDRKVLTKRFLIIIFT